MKQRFSSLDVRIIAHELSAALVSLRLANIYDLSTRIFLLKFAKPNHREQLLVDSGFRCHLTSFARSTASAPGNFNTRLRKFLRTRRVTKVEQVGTDRVIEIQFSDGQYRLFLEFYAGGNIVLTDSDLTILGLLRSVSEGEEHEQYKLGLKLDLSQRQNFAGVPELTKERLKIGLQRAIERQQVDAAKPGKKAKKKSGDALRKALAVTTTEFPPILIDHALHVTGFNRETLPEDVLGSEELLEKLLRSLAEAQNVVAQMTSAQTTKGYIIAKRRQPQQLTDEQADGTEPQGSLMYQDFHPFKPAHFATDTSEVFLEYEGFNKTCDEFFSSLEGQKLEFKLQEREENAKRKLDAARSEQDKRIGGLQQVQETNVRRAQAIEANVERVEEATAAVNGLIAQEMDWMDIGRLIEKEQARNNPVAQTIKLPLKLHDNTITILLSEYDQIGEDDDMADETESEASSDSEDESAPRPAPKNIEDKRLAIDIGLASSAWSNARQYYTQRRSAAVKQEKTAQASQKALKSTEQKVMADLKRGLKQEKDVLRPVRKQMWFEKFLWFLSSDGYLVLAGRDVPQNETIYRRYLRKGDIFVHADLSGAAPVVVKNNPKNPNAPIPPSTLSQAGQLCVCTSSAWDSKAGMAAWWVNADQVSKTAPTGEYLTTGGFNIKGKKTFLLPAQLLLGFGLLWQVSEESKTKHVRHRVKDEPQISGMAKGDAAGDASEDDEFPDASAGVASTGGLDDDDDDFPDAPAESKAEDGDEEEDDDLLGADDEKGNGPGDEDEDYQKPSQSNPLQARRNSVQQQSEDEDSEHNEDDEDGPGQLKADAAAVTVNNHEHDTEGTRDADAAAQSDNKSDKGASQATTSASKIQAKLAQQQQQQQQQPRSKPTLQPRGKKSKAKRAAAKYADQDEEDRELAMRLLGSKPADSTTESAAAVEASKKESQEETRARRRAQHEKTQREGLEAEEVRRLNLEEGVDANEEEEATTSLDALVGTALPGDEILDAIPVCAPWSAMSKFKYKVKLQPGQQKKGKAVREILFRWTKDASDVKKIDSRGEDSERIWPREGELVRGLKEAEVVGVVPVKNLRVVMSGGGGGAEKGKGGKGGGGGGKGGRGGKGSKGGKGGKKK